MSPLTIVFFEVNLVFLDGTDQAEQLDKAALITNQSVDVATSQDLRTRILMSYIISLHIFKIFDFTYGMN